MGAARESDAGLLRERLQRHVADARRSEAPALAGDAEGVHDLRVALRRSRSLLTTFGPALDGDGLDGLLDDLRDCGLVLSETRDHDVVREVVDALLAEEPATPDAAAVGALLDAGGPATDAVQRLLDGPLYRPTMAALEQRAAALPDVPPDQAWPLLAAEWRRLKRRVEAARTTTGEEHVALLHRARKAAKRARYAAETLAPVYGERAHRIADLARGVQDALGDQRDTVLVRARLRALAEQHPVAALEAGRLDRRAEVRGEQALARYEELARQVCGVKVRRKPPKR
jgi:CHAD domain-containing protein